MIHLCRNTLLAALVLLVLSAGRAEALFGEELVKVRADDFRGGDSFAFAVDLGGGLLISGAVRDDDGADDSVDIGDGQHCRNFLSFLDGRFANLQQLCDIERFVEAMVLLLGAVATDFGANVWLVE